MVSCVTLLSPLGLTSNSLLETLEQMSLCLSLYLVLLYLSSLHFIWTRVSGDEVTFSWSPKEIN